MTNREHREKYSIGTRIKFITHSYSSDTARKDKGKIGTIVGFDYNHPFIFLPESKHVSYRSTKQRPVSWQTEWSSLEILSQKNQQLLFAFMN